MKTKFFFINVISFVLIFIFSLKKVECQTFSRSTMSSNASQFATSFSWTATSSNTRTTWNGDAGIGGKPVWAASWVNPGTNLSMPYSWGGFSTKTLHNTKMAAGKSAGNVCSNAGGGCTGGGDPTAVYASGLDCSGLATMSWSLAPHKSTTELDAESYPYLFMSQVLKGDLLNRHDETCAGGCGNHCRVVETYFPGPGTITVYEASAAGWNVSSHSYSIIALASTDYATPDSHYKARYSKKLCTTTKPTGLTNYQPTTTTTAYLIWSNESKTYNYRYKLTTGATWTYGYGLTSPSKVLSGLTPNKGYEFQVQSVCGGTSSWTSSFIFWTLPLKVASLTETEDKILIYPNPTTTNQKISIEAEFNIGEIDVISLDGRLISRLVLEESNNTIEIPFNISTGVYLLRIKTSNDKMLFKKLIIQ